MTLERLDNAIAELSEAKRLAELFGWPKSQVDDIALVLKLAVHKRNEVARQMEKQHGLTNSVSSVVR